MVARRMAPGDRRALLLEKATAFFADHGMSASTRDLAKACGVTQRLLYRYFPSKGALVEEIHEQAILAPFKAVWLVRLADRRIPIARRLLDFYADYFTTVLSRRWIRLFLFNGLAGAKMVPNYIQTIIMQMLTVVVQEAAASAALGLPDSPPLIHEIGWVLHGAVSHLAVRQHVYGASQALPLHDILEIQVAAFLAGLPQAVAQARAIEDRPRNGPSGPPKSSVYD